MRKINDGYWHSPNHTGTGLLLMFKGETVIGLLFTLGKSDKSIVATFTGPLANTNNLTLYNYSAAGWPGDGDHNGQAKEAGTISIENLVGDDLKIDVKMFWKLVGGVRPSPLPPEDFTENFTLNLERLV